MNTHTQHERRECMNGTSEYTYIHSLRSCMSENNGYTHIHTHRHIQIIKFVNKSVDVLSSGGPGDGCVMVVLAERPFPRASVHTGIVDECYPL